MTDITTRVLTASGATVKGAPLSSEEIDQNFINLNTDLVQLESDFGATSAAVAFRPKKDFVFAGTFPDPVQPHFAFKRISVVLPGSTTAMSTLGTSLSNTMTNQFTTYLFSPTYRANGFYQTSGTSGAAGVSEANKFFYMGTNTMGGFLAIMRIVGLGGQNASPSTTGLYVGMSGFSGGAILAALPPGATTWGISYNSGGSSGNINLPLFPRSDNGPFELSLYNAPGSSDVSYKFKNLVTGATTQGVIQDPANVPASTTALGFIAYGLSTAPSPQCGIGVISAYVESDY